jgi:hypothetical protein
VSNSVSSIWRGGIASVLSVALLALVGCGPAGPATVPVRGKITKDGKGVPGVIITLVGTDPNYIPTGESDDNGNFEITLAQSGKKGAMPGNYKVLGLPWERPTIRFRLTAPDASLPHSKNPTVLSTKLPTPLRSTSK